MEWDRVQITLTRKLGMSLRQYVKHSGQEALVILDLHAGESFSQQRVEENMSKSNIKHMTIYISHQSTQSSLQKFKNSDN